MRNKFGMGLMFVAKAVAVVVLCCPAAMAEPRPDAPRTIGDILWVWGNPEVDESGKADRTWATFAEASPKRRAELLGTPNVLMAGDGIPNDHRLAQLQTESVKHCKRIIWEIMPDEYDEQSQSHGNFKYRQRVAEVQEVKNKFPQIQGVLLDDMTSVALDKGLKPSHLTALRELLASGSKPLELWGVLYSMNFGRANINEYIKELDVINLWVWDAKDIPDLERHVAHCESTFPGKPIVLGLYLHDYGPNRRMPRDLHEQQCAVALKLAHKGRIAGIAFLTIDNDPEIVQWTAEWIKSVADQLLVKP